MDDHLPVPKIDDGTATLPAEVLDGLDAATDLMEARIAESTRNAYTRAFNRFSIWAESQGLCPLPADTVTVAAYLGLMHRRDLSPSRIGLVISAIAWKHRDAGHGDPTADKRISDMLKGARRLDAGRRKRKASPLLTTGDGGLPGILHQLVESISGDGLVDTRDRAIILVGHAGCLRRSEIAALQLGDIEWTPKGIILTVRKGKTDQVGQGLHKAIPHGGTHSPVLALKEWLMAIDTATGRERLAGDRKQDLPVFTRFTKPLSIHDASGAVVGHRPNPLPTATLSGGAINVILKERLLAANLDAATFSAHSLRSGFLTSAAQARKNILKMQAQSGHANLDVLAGYVQDADLFENNAADGLY